MTDRREATRNRVYLGGRIVHRFLRSDTNCLLRNLSSTGARVVVSAAIPLPDRFAIMVDSHGTTRSVVTVWRAGDEIGVRFTTDAPTTDGVDASTDGFQPGRTDWVRLRTRIADIEARGRSSEGALN